MAWTFFAWILLFNTLIALYIAWGLKSRNIRKSGSEVLVWMFIALAVWTFSYAMINLSVSLEAKRFWLKVENIGIVTTPTLWFLFVTTYTKQDKWLKKKGKLLLFLVPAITIALLFSERWFYLYYTSAIPYANNIGPLIIERGVWYKVQVIQSYLLLAVGTLLMLWHLVVFRDIYQKRILTVLSAFAAPVALNAFYQTGANIIPAIYIPVDLTPIAFTLTAWLINLAIYSQELFEMTPIARQIVLENIIEMVMVVDEKEHILDINRAGLEWLQRKEKSTIGKNILDLFTAYPQLADHYQRDDSENTIFSFTDNNQRRLNVSITPIYNRLGTVEGRVIIVRDTTKENLLKAELKEKTEKIALLEEKLNQE